METPGSVAFATEIENKTLATMSDFMMGDNKSNENELSYR
jgi:hypothetical protein